MVVIKVNRENDHITAFELSGHADSGPYGYDLVCAGVSAVSFGAVNAVLELCQIELDIDQGSEGGYLRVVIPDSIDPVEQEKAQLLFEGMLVSLRTIEQEYGEFITIEDSIKGGAD